MTDDDVRSRAAGPDEDARLRVSRPHRAAAGVTGVAVALAYAARGGGLRSLPVLNQVGGFDCPGCAWPDPHPGDRSLAEFCENGVKAVAEETTGAAVTPDFFAEHDVTDLHGRSDHWLGRQGRLVAPVYKDAGDDHYRPIGWHEAFDLVAAHLRAIDPDEAVFYTSGRTSNEAAFLYQLLARRLGTNNLPDCSNLCHESSGVALQETIGIGKGTVTLQDVETTDLVIIAGQNPGTNHPRMLSSLERAKANGARVVAINPLPEAGLIAFRNPQGRSVLTGSELADQHHPIRLGGDLWFFRALNAVLLERGAIDHDFIAGHTTGFDAFRESLQDLDWNEVRRATGLGHEAVESVADEVQRAGSVVVCWAMGLTQHHASVPSIREIVNFLLLRGNIGRPGAGACPVRGHSNVQGDRTVGINERPPAAFLDALGQEFGFAPPRADGYDVVAAVEAMRAGRVRFFMGMGGNFVRASPDTAATEAGMRTVGLTVHVSTKLNGSHAVPGRRSLILPTLGRTDVDVQETGEQAVTVEDSMGMVHASRGHRHTHHGLPSEVAIVAEIGSRLAGDIPWHALRSDYSLIRDRIEAVVPGFDDYNRRIAQPGGFGLPNGPRERRWTTPDGRAHFTVNTAPVLDCPPGHLILQTVRSHDQYNTTVYGLDDRYRGIRQGRRVVFVHPDDLAERGFADGDLVDLVSVWHDGERRAERFRAVAYPTARECAAAYFPETNVLVPLDSTALQSNTPTSKSVIIRLERHEGASHRD